MDLSRLGKTQLRAEVQNTGGANAWRKQKCRTHRFQVDLTLICFGPAHLYKSEAVHYVYTGETTSTTTTDKGLLTQRRHCPRQVQKGLKKPCLYLRCPSYLLALIRQSYGLVTWIHRPDENTTPRDMRQWEFCSTQSTGELQNQFQRLVRITMCCE